MTDAQSISTTTSLPDRARIVIVGGGVAGCSIAYHLANAGETDVVLLERKQLTCGTTWHAAGLVGQLRATRNMTKLAAYTAELFRTLEKETGQETGYKQNGSLTIAHDAERFEELRRSAAMARLWDLQVDVITPDEIATRYDGIRVDDLVGGIYLPADGQVNPIDVAQAMARGARHKGVRIHENTPVSDVRVDDDRVTEVTTPHGTIACDTLIIAAGMWSRDFARTIGVTIPLHAAEHFYVVTEPIPALASNLPALRDLGSCVYMKEDAGKLLVGAFEPEAKPWGHNGIADDFCFDQLPEDLDHFAPMLENAFRRLPLLESVGIQTFFNGPESFTPDNRYYLGRAPELQNVYVATGFNSVGIQSSGGAGKVLSEWVLDGHPSMDLWDVDIRRVHDFQGNQRYLYDRTCESLGLLYAMHWPFRQVETARGVRRTAFYDRHKELNACFGEAGGWERPNWYAPSGMEPVYRYSWGRQNWFDVVGQEHAAVRDALGMLDISTFSKFLVQGAGAEALLNKVCANNVAVPPGRIVYTQWLNARGGIESDLTVLRLSADEFMVMTAFSQHRRDLAWLKSHMDTAVSCSIADVTSAYAGLSIQGPQARTFMQGLTDADMGPDGFAFARAKRIDVGYATVWALRISYVGELGWELLIPADQALHVWETIWAHAHAVNMPLAPVGMHAMNGLRLEKGFVHWGEDVTDEDTPLEAGLGFAVAVDKGDFIGRDAFLRQREEGVKKRLVHFVLEDSQSLLYHNEPILRDGERVGYITSAMYGHTVGAAVGLGYVSDPAGGYVDANFVKSGTYAIDIGGTLTPAIPSLKAHYDPSGKRMRA